MQQINILFYVLGSFFGIVDNKIAADKTTVIIHPQSQEIEIIQEDLFTIIQSEKDTFLVIKQWNNIIEGEKVAWTNELENFTSKNLTINKQNDRIQPHLKLSYSNENELRLFGIWYNIEKNQFSINQVPNDNIQTKNGKLNGNYWVFNGDSTFSFTIEPFLQLPDIYQKNKLPIQDLFKAN